LSLLVVIVGPTAAGKTRLAIALARRFSGEIINADSRQVYRFMDIGTAKPTPQERQQARHQLLDILDPSQDFALGSFLALAITAIKDIRSLQNLPIVVGGTGQYIWALVEGWDVPQVPPDEGFRRLKEQEAREKGGQVLYEELQRIDQQRAWELDPRNVRRVIRALEIYHATRRKPSDYQKRVSPSETPLIIGLTLPRENLYQRIDQRVDKMMEAGLLEEVKSIAGMGYQLGQGPLDSPGYRELGQHLNGEISLEEAVQRTRFQTHHIARRQYTWFKPGDPRIRWLDAADPQLDEKAIQLVNAFYPRSRPVLQ
jgi:tRNA dimethylallyltransferase